MGQGSSEKQNQQGVCIEREIYFKEFVHTAVEAWQAPNVMQ